MVYFFGGAFNSGGNIQYPGHFLAARDVVVVVVNYRVDIFGKDELLQRHVKWLKCSEIKTDIDRVTESSCMFIQVS